MVAYRGAIVSKPLTLDVAAGEILAMIGPSGSGKTTALRAVAGFVRPLRGASHIGGADVTDLPPYERGLAMVVQNYALFPHMRVADNVAFGLKARGAAKKLIEERVNDALRIVGMQKFLQRYPRELSGGQQQRVAIARALAVRPRVLLLDEPLSALDAQIRRSMVEEIARLHADLPGLTILYVTHDQSEALTLADRIAILKDGSLSAIGRTSRSLSAPAQPVRRGVSRPRQSAAGGRWREAPERKDWLRSAPATIGWWWLATGAFGRASTALRSSATSDACRGARLFQPDLRPPARSAVAGRTHASRRRSRRHGDAHCRHPLAVAARARRAARPLFRARRREPHSRRSRCLIWPVRRRRRDVRLQWPLGRASADRPWAHVSLSACPDRARGPRWRRGRDRLQRFLSVLHSRAFLNALINTGLIALAATAECLALGVTLALILAFVPFPGSTFVARLIDTFIALPTFLVTLAFTFLYGSGRHVERGAHHSSA